MWFFEIIGNCCQQQTKKKKEKIENPDMRDEIEGRDAVHVDEREKRGE
jgi:hypothetical protein